MLCRLVGVWTVDIVLMSRLLLSHQFRLREMGMSSDSSLGGQSYRREREKMGKCTLVLPPEVLFGFWHLKCLKSWEKRMEDGLVENWPLSDTFFSLLVIILGPTFCSFSPFYRNKKISGQFLTDFFKEINSLLPLAPNFILQQIWQFWIWIFSNTSLLQTLTTYMFKTS